MNFYAMAVPDLSTSHKTAIRKSWGKLDAEKHGMLLKLRTFQRNPNYQDLFDEFQGKTIEQLITSSYQDVFMHAKPTMKALNFAVENMNNPAAFRKYFTDLAKSSSAVPMDIEFSNIQSIIVDCWKESLGELDNLTEEAWAILLKGICDIMMGTVTDDVEIDDQALAN